VEASALEVYRIWVDFTTANNLTVALAVATTETWDVNLNQVAACVATNSRI